MTLHDKFHALDHELSALNHAMAAAPNGSLNSLEYSALEGLRRRLIAEKRDIGEQLYAAAKSAAEQVMAERERRNS